MAICVHLLALTAVLLTLFLVVIIVDTATEPRPLDQWTLRIRGVQIGGYTSNHNYNPAQEFVQKGYSVTAQWRVARFAWLAVAKRDARSEWHLTMSIIVPAIVMALFPTLWYRSRFRRLCARMKSERRSARGLCVRCGYDLRESKERCPECGAFVARASAAAV
jgi:hypothetical protein